MYLIPSHIARVLPWYMVVQIAQFISYAWWHGRMERTMPPSSRLTSFDMFMTLEAMFLWESITPLEAPVVPDVNMRVAI